MVRRGRGRALGRPGKPDRGAGELERDFLHQSRVAHGAPGAGGERRERAHRRQAIVRERRLGAGIVRDALEQLRLEAEREAAVALAMPVRAGKAVSGVRPADTTLRTSSDVPCRSRTTKLPESTSATLLARGQFLGLVVARPAGADDVLDPPAVAGRERRVGECRRARRSADLRASAAASGSVGNRRS